MPATLRLAEVGDLEVPLATGGGLSHPGTGDGEGDEDERRQKKPGGA